MTASFVGVGAVHAGEGDTKVAPSKEAEALFREGRDAMKKGDYDLACRKFDESRRIDPALGTVLNLALCEEGRGQLARALSLVKEFLKRAPQNDDRRPLALEQIRQLSPRVPRLILEPESCSPIGCDVTIDGHTFTLRDSTVSVPIDPGEHRVRVSVAGGPTREIIVDLSEGETAVQPIQGSESQQAVSPPLDDSGTRRTTVYVIGGVGAAALVAGLVTGAFALDKWQTVKAQCSGDTCDSESGVSASSDGRTLAIVSTVTFAAGVIGLGAATYLYLTIPTPTSTDDPLGERATLVGLTGQF